MQPPVKLLLLVTLALGGALGFLAGRGSAPEAGGNEELLRALERQQALLQSMQARLERPQVEGRCAVATQGAAGVEPEWLRAELARVLREELDARGVGAASRPREPEPAPTPPAPQSVAALEGAHRLIEDAVRSRQWGEQQAQEMRRLLIDMTPAQRQEILPRLTQALNSGGISVTVLGQPF